MKARAGRQADRRTGGEGDGQNPVKKLVEKALTTSGLKRSKKRTTLPVRPTARPRATEIIALLKEAYPDAR